MKMSSQTQSLRKARFAKGATASILATAVVLSTGVATADEGLPGTTGNTVSDDALPGTTGNTTAPAAPAQPAQEPTEVAYTPMPQTQPIPAPVQNYAPQMATAAQPLQRAEPEIRYVQGKPIVITETEYIDRQVVEESGGLWILTDEGRKWVTAKRVIEAAGENYNQRDQGEKNKLNIAATAAALGATGGFLLGAGIGTLAGSAGLGATALATASIPVVITAPVPIVGQVTATGATAAAIAAALFGGGAGLVLGGGAGSAIGADAAMNASGQKPAVQDFIADIIFTLENGAREDAGFRGLVGDKPSGLRGYRDVDAGSDTRDTDGTLLGEGTESGRHASGADPVSEFVDSLPRHALPEIPQPQEVVETAVQTTETFVENTTTAVNDAQQQAADFVADPQAGVAQAQEQFDSAVTDAQQQATSFVEDATAGLPNANDLLPL